MTVHSGPTRLTRKERKNAHVIVRVKLKTPSPVPRQIREEGEKFSFLREEPELFFLNQTKSTLLDGGIDSFHLDFEAIVRFNSHGDFAGVVQEEFPDF